MKNEAIVIRNDCIDDLVEVENSLDKAEVILEHLQEVYTSFLPCGDVNRRWACEQEKICAFIQIGADYVYTALGQIKELKKSLYIEVDMLREGVESENGRS